jgi:hypothetical protein
MRMENGRRPFWLRPFAHQPAFAPWIARFAHAAFEARRFAGSRAEVLTKTGRNSSWKTVGPAARAAGPFRY